MANILNGSQCARIDVQRRKFKPYAKKGWMCEGSDVFGPCNAIFNNETNEVFWADYNGNILDSDCLKETPIEDIKTMAIIQGAISKISLE